MLEKDYERELAAQKSPYLTWLAHQEKITETREETAVIEIPFSSCEEPAAPYMEAIAADDSALLLFYGQKGTPDSSARTVFARSEGEIIYADEDYLGEDGRRCRPWFKPEYSPDTLRSFFYYGHIFAIRAGFARKAWRALLWDSGRDSDDKVSLYEFMLFASGVAAQVCHIPRVLYTNESLEAIDELPGCGMKLRLVPDTNWWRRNHGRILHGERLVSIIIPSRDNGEVLMRCIDTLIARTTYSQYEIIIVDNGSNEEHRQWISEQLTSRTGTVPQYETQLIKNNIRYAYQPQPFNFAALCNQGAALAQGRYLLFLNDDIEIIDGEWLSKMLVEAIQYHIGAVGAKLIYPQSNRIQHAGITNMGIGPAHKLAGMADEGCLYHGHNLVTYNMLAVTGACLLVNREKFKQAGGFDEELAVAYNDVELCFSLYEKGYYNVVCNEAVLLHHESMSRGQDDTPERQNRLREELAYLYRKHPSLQGTDPFYSPHLVQWSKDADYRCEYLFDCDKKVTPRRISRLRLPYAWRTRLFRRLTGANRQLLTIDSSEMWQETLVVEGWYVLRGCDNAGLTRWLILRHEGGAVYRVPLYPKLREDVEPLFDTDGTTTHVALSGVHAVIDISNLPHGRYTLGVAAGGKHGKRIQYASGGGCLL